MTELKPCPFCGSSDVEAMLDEYAPEGRKIDWWMIKCWRCSAEFRTIFCDKENVIQQWNRRLSSLWESSATPGKTWVIGPDTGKGVDMKKITEEMWKELEEYEKREKND